MNLENSFLQEIKGLIVIELSNIEKLKKEEAEEKRKKEELAQFLLEE